jgi:hypothetical protein
MADSQVEKEDRVRTHFIQQLKDGFLPRGAVKAEDRQAAALDFIAFALGEMVKEMRELRETLQRLPR